MPMLFWSNPLGGIGRRLLDPTSGRRARAFSSRGPVSTRDLSVSAREHEFLLYARRADARSSGESSGRSPQARPALPYWKGPDHARERSPEGR
jgi:hypothetical protein